MLFIFNSLFKKDKKPAKSLIGKIQIKLNEALIVSVLPSPEGKCMQGAEDYLAPEISQKPIISKGKEGVNVYRV